MMDTESIQIAISKSNNKPIYQKPYMKMTAFTAVAYKSYQSPPLQL